MALGRLAGQVRPPLQIAALLSASLLATGCSPIAKGTAKATASTVGFAAKTTWGIAKFGGKVITAPLRTAGGDSRSSSSGGGASYTVHGRRYHVMSPPQARGYRETGSASYYGRESGPRTANGERYSTRAMTAAHKTLPFGTKVRVTNLGNGRSVVVRINDRGPFIRGRIIDLTPAGANRLKFKQQGIARVRVETVR